MKVIILILFVSLGNAGMGQEIKCDTTKKGFKMKLNSKEVICRKNNLPLQRVGVVKVKPLNEPNRNDTIKYPLIRLDTLPRKKEQ